MPETSKSCEKMRDFTKKYFHLNSSAVYNSSAKNEQHIFACRNLDSCTTFVEEMNSCLSLWCFLDAVSLIMALMNICWLTIITFLVGDHAVQEFVFLVLIFKIFYILHLQEMGTINAIKKGGLAKKNHLLWIFCAWQTWRTIRSTHYRFHTWYPRHFYKTGNLTCSIKDL